MRHREAMAVVVHLTRHLAPVVDLVYPPRCPACGEAIAGREGLCSDCWTTLELPDSPDSGAGVPVFAATAYGDTSRRLVLSYKHGGRIALARLMAQMIAARMPICPPGEPQPVLVPVPLNRWRLWQRGFNQAALLARELVRLGKGEIVVDALMRHRRTPQLGGLGREARERALAGAISINPARAPQLKGRKIILIDDVLTSGATSRACLAALAEVEPAGLAVACFAQVAQGDGLHSPDWP